MGVIQDWKINIACADSLVRKRPIFAAWHITYRCNLQCKFCSFWKNEVDLKREFTVKDFEESSKKLTKLGVRVVNLAGGEPFVRKDLPDIVRAFTSDHIVIINSNGSMINRENARAIWEAGTDVMNISLDFYSKEKHDFYRGKGVYEKALNAIELLKQTRLRKTQKIAMQAILSAENYNEFEELVKLAEKLEVEFTFNPYRPGEHEVDLGMKDYDLSMLYDLKKKYKYFKATSYALDRTVEFVKNGYSPNCGMGKYMIALDPYGNIGPCEARLELLAGNIREFESDKILSKLNKIHSENSCSSCLTRERSEVEPLYHFGGWEWMKNLFDVRKG
ncbi:MAG: radical SAM protein [Clostridia bacterium]|nr:radical SAM protein [Clostridia bacterium]